MQTKNHDILTAEVKAHLDADALVRDEYWNGSKGCFIGCLTHSSDPTLAAERFGLPVEIMRIAEDIFEALPRDEGRAFFASLPDAVGRDGKDLSRVHWQFLAAELRALPVQIGDVSVAIGAVVDGMDLLAAGKEWSKSAARAAADDAAWAAARAASRAADDAARAAEAAARAAAWAAWAAARIRQRDTLIRLISEAT